jgi:endonuclease-3
MSVHPRAKQAAGAMFKATILQGREATGEEGNQGEWRVEIHPPPNWEEIYEAVKEMRKKVLAPVDTMGCETLAQEHSSPRVRAQIQGLPT